MPGLVFGGQVKKDEGYCVFKPAITTKAHIRETIEAHPAIAAENNNMEAAVLRWWESVRPAVEALPRHNHVAKLRRESIELLKKQFGTMNILDEFQHAGVFVNWWEAVRWDMKTVVSSGWSQSLIPDDYIKNAFFKKELGEIDSLEAKAVELESDLSEILEEAEIDENGDEENGTTVKAIKSYLKEQIAGLRDAKVNSAEKEASALRKTLEAIEEKEKELKTAKRSLKEKIGELEEKIEEKRKAFTEAEAKGLILEKVYDLARGEMYRYLNSRKRSIVGILEKLWDKYKTPLTGLASSRDKSGLELNRFLNALHYLD